MLLHFLLYNITLTQCGYDSQQRLESRMASWNCRRFRKTKALLLRSLGISSWPGKWYSAISRASEYSVKARLSWFLFSAIWASRFFSIMLFIIQSRKTAERHRTCCHSHLDLVSDTERHNLTAAAQTAYPNKFSTFPTKLIKYLHNLIEIYMYIGYRLRQRQRQIPVGVLELRSCGTSQRIQYYFKVNLVNFLLFWYFLCIFPIKLMFASIIIPNTTTELPLIRKL